MHDRKALLESLRRQLAAEKENLLLIQERKSEFVMETSVPLDLIKEERRTEKQIEELEQRIKVEEGALGQPTPTAPSDSTPSSAHTTSIGSVTGPVHTGAGDIRIEHYHTPSVSPPRSQPEPEQYEALGPDRILWKKDGKEMVRVPAGKFLYGDEKAGRELDEFWIDKTPVTNEEYARFVANTDREPPEHWEGKAPPEERADHPIVNVSWRDARAYAEWAGKWLPTEEEWEKAARGADGREYPWGDQEPTYRLCNVDNDVGDTTPVGRYSPQGDSPYGCVDMAGNVWEWTRSREGELRVLRGGSFDRERERARCASRIRDYQDVLWINCGFRGLVSLSSSQDKR
jgi:formylglycine-generating enzyme required for sulfatase activity